ncbi:MAG: tetraacyldisaccharide 4'-kinase [Pseudomonadota bacterium]
MSQGLARCWYGDCPAGWRLAVLLLLPFSLLFFMLAGLRRLAYRHGLRASQRLPVPVIVVGNLTAGGAGKTPLTLALVDLLRRSGWQPGVISRGHGADTRVPRPVLADSTADQVGDEPLLIARRSGAPVWVGRRRAQAGQALLAAHPEVNVLVADDGLQHLALARDVELVVVDGERGFGNGLPLPAGPLREPISRLASVSAVVVNGGPGCAGDYPVPCFAMALVGHHFVNLVHPEWRVAAGHFRGRVHALAGIGHPQRFFRRLAELGLDVDPHPFPDHHAYVAADLPPGTVLMTEKDAVKCAAFARDDCWFLAVDAEVEGGLKPLLDHLLKAPCHGPEAA